MSKDEFIDAHHSSLYLQQLWLSWEHHDVVLVCSDGEKLPAHKLILLSRSDYFKRMFASGVHSDENPVNFPYSSDCLKKILGFLYSGKMNLKDCHFRVLLEIMDASRMMLMNFQSEYRPHYFSQISTMCPFQNEKIGLSYFVEDYITEKVYGIPDDDYSSDYEDDEFEVVNEESSAEVGNINTIEESKYNQVVEILNFSITNRFPPLMNATISFLKEEAHLFLLSKAFSNLSFPSLSELLSLDALAESGEIAIFRAVVRWLNSSHEHMDHKDDALELIRFNEMSVSELIDKVKPTGLFEDKELMEKVESVRKDKGKNENGRKVLGRWGCMEKASRVPMWIREIEGKRPSLEGLYIGVCPFYSSGSCERHNSHKPFTEHGFLPMMTWDAIKRLDKKTKDNDYVPEDDTEEESDSTSDEDEQEEESRDVYKNPVESHEELDAYIRERNLL